MGSDMSDGARRGARLETALRDLAKHAPDVEAAAVVSLDGLPMASVLPADTDEQRVAAMSAALLSLGERASEGLGRGGLKQVYVEGEAGTVFLVGAGDRAVLAAVTGRDAKVGMMLFELRHTAGEVAAALGTAPATPAPAPVFSEGLAAPADPAPVAAVEQHVVSRPAPAPAEAAPAEPGQPVFAEPSVALSAPVLEAPTDQAVDAEDVPTVEPVAVEPSVETVTPFQPAVVAPAAAEPVVPAVVDTPASASVTPFASAVVPAVSAADDASPFSAATGTDTSPFAAPADTASPFAVADGVSPFAAPAEASPFASDAASPFATVDTASPFAAAADAPSPFAAEPEAGSPFAIDEPLGVEPVAVEQPPAVETPTAVTDDAWASLLPVSDADDPAPDADETVAVPSYEPVVAGLEPGWDAGQADAPAAIGLEPAVPAYDLQPVTDDEVEPAPFADDLVGDPTAEAAPAWEPQPNVAMEFGSLSDVAADIQPEPADLDIVAATVPAQEPVELPALDGPDHETRRSFLPEAPPAESGQGDAAWAPSASVWS
jgi:uncharacterized protein